MSDKSNESTIRYVLLFRQTKVCETEMTSIETSLLRSELTGNHILEQTSIGPNETTAALVVFNTETIQKLIPHLKRIVTE
jgi:hypothetical protein